jgi:hypothetical protein
MFGFSIADWLFIGFILVVVAVCVVLSGRLRGNRKDNAS